MTTRTAALLLTLGASLGAQSSFRITTVAGSDPGGDGTAAVTAALATPEGLAVDAAGQVYFADSSAHRVRRVNSAGKLETLAGNASAGSRGDGGPAALAVLHTPYGIALDPTSARVVIADFGNGRVRRIGTTGIIETVLAGLTGPRNLAFDSSGNLFVSDYLGHRVYRIPASGGTIETVAGTGAADSQLTNPAGLAVDASGAVYVADSGNKIVRRIAAGLSITILGGPDSAVALGAPVGLAIDRAGNLYVADASSRRLVRRTRDGVVTFVPDAGQPELDAPPRDVAVDSHGAVYVSVGAQVLKLSGNAPPSVVAGGANVATPGALQGPIGVAADTSGNVYIAEERAALIRKLPAGGGALETIAGGGTTFGDGGAAVAAKLTDPVALAWDPVAGLRIVEYLGHRVRGILPSTTIYTVAGDGLPGFRGDGAPATQSQLNRPRAAAFDRAGNLYIADSLNHRIRKVGANGFLSTVAGSGTRGYAGDGGAALQAQLNTPQGVTVDSAGNIYIADSLNHAVRVVKPDGSIATAAGTGVPGFSGDGGAATQAQLNSPIGLAVDAQDRLIIADTFNHRVRRLTRSGVIETIAGDGSPGFWGDGGAATLAQLNSPAAVAVDRASGSIYIADLDNHRIRRLDPETPAPTAPDAPAPATPLPPPGELIVMNGASLRSDAIAAGAILALFGAPGIGPEQPVQAELSADRRLPFTLAGVEVRIDGIPAAIFYAGPGQINVEAPRTLRPQPAALVEVWREAKPVAAARVEVRLAQPALFTRAAGDGQALAINEDGSLNSADRPAARGSIVTLFGTGEGETLPLAVDVLVGQARADVLFAGRAPGFVGLLQVNIRLPGIFTPPGVRPLTLTVGGAASQPGVTIAVK